MILGKLTIEDNENVELEQDFMSVGTDDLEIKLRFSAGMNIV